MNPIEEQRLRDEVIYLHSLWRQGPPRTPNPIPNSNASHWHQFSPPNYNTNPRPVHIHNPSIALHRPSNPVPFKKPAAAISKQKRIKARKNSTNNQSQSQPKPDPGPEWPYKAPVVDPSPETSGWPALKPCSAQATVPVSSEERAKFIRVKMQNKVLEACRKFFEKRVDSDGEEDDDDEGDEDYWIEKNVGVEGSEDFEFFMRMFVEDSELRNYFENNTEGGEFFCFVCGGIGKKGSNRKFKGCLGLLQHSTAISKTSKKRSHMAFAQVVCKVIAWDIDRLPVIVVKGEPFGRSLANPSELQGKPNRELSGPSLANLGELQGKPKESTDSHKGASDVVSENALQDKPKENTDGDKDGSDVVRDNADSIDGNDGESVLKESSNVYQNNDPLMLSENSKEDDANMHTENADSEVLEMGAKKEGATDGLNSKEDDANMHTENIDRGVSHMGAKEEGATDGLDDGTGLKTLN